MGAIGLMGAAFLGCVWERLSIQTAIFRFDRVGVNSSPPQPNGHIMIGRHEAEQEMFGGQFGPPGEKIEPVAGDLDRIFNLGRERDWARTPPSGRIL